MNKYFYVKHNKQYGPCTIEQLRTRSIDRNTMVWTEGMEEWLPAEDVPEVSEMLPPPTPFSETPPSIEKTFVLNLFPSKGITEKIVWALIGILVFVLIIRSLK